MARSLSARIQIGLGFLLLAVGAMFGGALAGAGLWIAAVLATATLTVVGLFVMAAHPDSSGEFPWRQEAA